MIKIEFIKYINNMDSDMLETHETWGYSMLLMYEEFLNEYDKKREVSFAIIMENKNCKYELMICFLNPHDPPPNRTIEENIKWWGITSKNRIKDFQIN